ncbi:Oidioi.mRNA.OKI2018_I69.PAR.g9169.t1.cds [Oikopleura dioica]|uniref:Oidioi.mRNA.OKI2018_I69.PAR.g9169.t1.cds n=1 Tax=Oikopleura dioica TaxID=34765 RepID=A0ABN7RMR1_OIKDI|nr:Oidioi.mRNA.OKI2018_I69.PAR.g9169.t1.cds [Oikopleura dioica]
MNEFKKTLQDELTLFYNAKTDLHLVKEENKRLKDIEDRLNRTKKELEDSKIANCEFQQKIEDLEEDKAILDCAKKDAEERATNLSRQVVRMKMEIRELTSNNEKLQIGN